MTINKITNGFIVLFVVLSCRIGWRRSTLRLYSHWVCSTNKFRVIREIRAKLIVNFQFSIEQQRFFLVFNILTINKNSFLCLLACEGKRQFKETLHVILR